MNHQNLTQLARQAAIAASQHQYWQAIQHYTDVLGQVGPNSTDPAARETRLTALRERGRLLGLVGEQEAALLAMEQYLREAYSDEMKIDALVNVGGRSRGIGRFPQALTAYRQALKLAEAVQDENGRARALAGIGLTNLALGQHEEAVKTLIQANSLFDKTGNAAQQIRTLNRLGVAYAYSGQMDKAIAAFSDALNLSRKIGQQDTAVAALNNLGECHQHLFDYKTALTYHQEGLPLAEEAQMRVIQSDIYRNIGLELSYLGRLSEGLAYLDQALQLSQETKHMENEAYTLYALALVELEQGMVMEAQNHAEALKQKAEKNDLRNLIAFAYHALGLCAKRRGETAVAEQMWQQALFLAHEANNRTLLWKTHAALAQNAALPELASVHFRIAAEVIQQIAYPIANERLRQKFLTAPPVQAVLSQVAI